MDRIPFRHFIFLDDERFPNENTFPDAGKRTIYIVRAFDEFVSLMYHLSVGGFDAFTISFDHDLGANEPSGMDVAKWLVERDQDEYDWLNRDFKFYVHSQNPVGKANIESLLNNYMKFKYGDSA